MGRQSFPVRLTVGGGARRLAPIGPLQKGEDRRSYLARRVLNSSAAMRGPLSIRLLDYSRWSGSTHPIRLAPPWARSNASQWVTFYPIGTWRNPGSFRKTFVGLSVAEGCLFHTVAMPAAERVAAFKHLGLWLLK